MDISTIFASNTASSAASGSAQSTTQSGLGNSDFMMMLIAQLKNQNPLEPMQDNELVSQVTLLNSLQELQKITGQMEQLAQASQASYASSLVGKSVIATYPDGIVVEGTVTGMVARNGAFHLVVNEKEVPLAYVNRVTSRAKTEQA